MFRRSRWRSSARSIFRLRKFIQQGVPSFVPWHLFWAYFVGFALVAASLSIATRIQVRWSGLLFGIMMFLFVAMMHIPGALASPGNRIRMDASPPRNGFRRRRLASCGSRSPWAGQRARRTRSHHRGPCVRGDCRNLLWRGDSFCIRWVCPEFPLEKLMPEWIPGRVLVGYLTGVFLLVAGTCILLGKKTRMAATYLGAWIVLLVVFVYGPVLMASLADPKHAQSKLRDLTTFSTRCCLAERFSRWRARCHARIRTPSADYDVGCRCVKSTANQL